MNNNYNSFLDTVKQLKSQFPEVSIHYLDPQITPSTEEFPHIELKIKQNVFSLRRNQSSSRLSIPDVERLTANLGIDAEGAVKSALHQDNHRKIINEIGETYHRLGFSRSNGQLNKWQRFLTKKFGAQHYKYTQDHVELKRLLFRYSNLIAVSSRLGRADFMIVSPKMAMHIEQDPEFVHELHGMQQPHLSQYTIVGTYLGMTVFRNALSSRNEDVIIGKGTRENNIGVYYIQGPEEFINQMDTWQTKKIMLTSFYSIEEVGPAERLYYAEKIVIGKKPLWRKLLFI